jgi:hypothetical protein
LSGDKHVRDTRNGELGIRRFAQRTLQGEPGSEQDQPDRELGNGVLVGAPCRQKGGDGERGEADAEPLVVKTRQRRPMLGKEKGERHQQCREREREARGIGWRTDAGNCGIRAHRKKSRRGAG